MRVLVIDDDDFVLRLLAQQLKVLGVAHICLVERANDALELLTRGEVAFDLLLCDLNMPGMDGIQLVHQLAELCYRGALVLLSGEDERILQTAERLARAEHLNVIGVLSKPASLGQLRDLLLRSAERGGEAPARLGQRVYGAEDLRLALSSGEIVNHYQPQVDLMTGALVGVEALARWQHPRDGLIPPDQFIPLVEQAGLMGELTQGVLIDALRRGREWLEQGLNLRVSVNASMQDLERTEFPENVAQLAAEHGFPLDQLVVEVTESQLNGDRNAMLEVAARLRLKRIGLAIDDFGTGYSSLAQLRDLPFDELKLDRGFVHGAANNLSLRAIVTSHLGMAAELGIKVVAEGIEDRQDWDFLRGAGCQLAQGYFIGRPMPGEALPAWLTDWRLRHQALMADYVQD